MRSAMRLFLQLATLFSLCQFSIQDSFCFKSMPDNSIKFESKTEDGMSCTIEFSSDCDVKMDIINENKDGCHKERGKVMCYCKGRHCNADFKKYLGKAKELDSSISKCAFSSALSFAAPSGNIDCLAGTTSHPFDDPKTFYHNDVWRRIERTMSFPGRTGVCAIRFLSNCDIEIFSPDSQHIKFLEKCSRDNDNGKDSAYCTCMYKDNCNSDIAYWKEEVYWTVKDMDFSHCDWKHFPDYPAVMGTTPPPR